MIELIQGALTTVLIAMIRDKISRNRSVSKGLVLIFAMLMTNLAISFLFPATALAADVGFSDIITSLRFLVTAIGLPLGIVVSAWKIIYLVVFCGIGGFDPLGMLDSDKNGMSDTSDENIWRQVKVHFLGFIYGVAWVVGIWVIFQFALGVASLFVQTLNSSGLFA